jgi:hypothetical protein
MTETLAYPNTPDVAADDYVVVGLATCFLRDDGEVHPVQILEPIPSAALEALVRGIPTSYEWAYATVLGEVWDGSQPKRPAQFPESAQFCDDFGTRAIAASRTYKVRPAAQTIVPADTVRQDFNYSTERKRVLNSERLVKTEDDVKQHAYTHQVL